MLRTRITDLLQIKHPIMLAGMNWVTEPGLVSAVCNAGGLGIMGISRCNPDETRSYIREIRKRTDMPFGINQSLTFPLARENLAIAVEEKVPIINYALGRPWFIEEVHKYGGKVIGTIAIARHAARAEQLGVDAIVVTGHEAGGHAHNATSMVLIPIVASMVKVPIIAAGGFFDGRGLAAALVLGADAISMGTRFMLTRESIVHERFKELYLQATEQDTLYSARFDGMPDRVLKSTGAEKVMKSRFPVRGAISGSLEVKRMFGMSWWDFIRSSLKMAKGGDEGINVSAQARMAASAMRYRKAIYDGDTREGILPAGQDTGGIQDIPSCKELVERIIVEAEKTLEVTMQKTKL
jgi:enoyl-[acyl-carrier protein] reductase II